jgi:hypothetical protein
MRRRGLLFAGFLVLVIVPFVTLKDPHDGGGHLVAPAAACTGPLRFNPSLVVTLPRDGSIAPRNTRVWFLYDAAAAHALETRPTEPARVRYLTNAVAGPDARIETSSSTELRLLPTNGNDELEVLLPTGLAPPWGTDGKTLGRVSRFRRSAVDDVTPPKLRVSGALTFNQGGKTSCGPSASIDVPVAIEDESQTFVQLGVTQSGGPSYAPVVNGRVRVSDAPEFDNDGKARTRTQIVLIPVDVAGNKGAAVVIDLHRAASGGASATNASAPITPVTEKPRARFGCGKTSF